MRKNTQLEKDIVDAKKVINQERVDKANLFKEY